MEAEFLEMDGWQAESDAEILLAGIGLDRAFFYDKMEKKFRKEFLILK